MDLSGGVSGMQCITMLGCSEAVAELTWSTTVSVGDLTSGNSNFNSGPLYIRA